MEADGQDQADHKRVVGWNLSAMTEEHLEAAEKLWREVAKERAHLRARCTEYEVELMATWCQEAMSTVLNPRAKMIRISAILKRGCNADIKERRTVVGRERRRRNPGEAARANGKLQKLIRQSKNTMWSEYLQNIRGAEVWRTARYTKPRSGMSVVALTDRDANQPNTTKEKEEMLRC